MLYRYFECECGNKFNAFCDKDSTDINGKIVAECPTCKAKPIAQWNDPKANGTRMLFNYMER